LFATEDNEDYWDAYGIVKFPNWLVGWWKWKFLCLYASPTPKTNLGIELMREMRDVQKYTWNRVDTKIGSVTAKQGSLKE
jgi:hypothetical protein